MLIPDEWEDEMLLLLQANAVLVEGSHVWLDLAFWPNNNGKGGVRKYSKKDLIEGLKVNGLSAQEASALYARFLGDPETRVVNPLRDKERLPLHPAGYQTIGSDSWYIQKDSSPLCARKGDCSAVLREVCRMMGNEAPLLLGWLKGAYMRQLNYAAEVRDKEAPYKKVASQTLVIAGAPGTGKTHVMLNMIIAGLLGDYATMPAAWLTGDTRFNDWALNSNIWVADDGVSLQSIVKRKHAGTVLKNTAYASKFSIECKNKAVINMPYPCERIFVVNLTESALRALPSYEEDVDKYLILYNCGDSGLHTEWGGDSVRMQQNLADMMPAFAYWLLNEYQLPDWAVRDTVRHTVADWGYISPYAQQALSELDEAGILMARLSKVYMTLKKQHVSCDKAYSQEELRQLLEQVEHNSLCCTKTAMGHQLAACQRRWPELLGVCTRNGYTCYKLLKNDAWENPVSIDIGAMHIAQPDPALLSAAGLPEGFNPMPQGKAT